MNRFKKILEFIGTCLVVLFIAVVAIILYIGFNLIIEDFMHENREAKKRLDKIEKMQYIKDSLTVEALKRNLIEYEKDSTKRHQPCR